MNSRDSRPTSAPWDDRDRGQRALLAARLSLPESALNQAWADPNRGPGCDLAEVLVRRGALSPAHATALRQHQSSAGGTQPDAPTPASRGADFRTVEVSAPAVVARAEPPSRLSSGAAEPVSSTTAPQIGSRIGPYELVAELGQGGMGLVYEARSDNLTEPVALKLLPFGQASDRARERFEIEGQTMLRLRHRNIVRVLDLRAEPGLSWMALELVRGGSLQDRLKAEGGTLVVEETLELGSVLADALDYAHQRGVIHRDMKPANVLIHEDGTPLITDFGLAKEVEKDDQGLTRSGDMLGTPGYMAPEQIESSAFVDGRADIYGLGVTMFRCLTGRLPFDSDNTLALMAAVLASDPPALRKVDPNLPVDVETIVARCLAREPERRYDSAAELAEDCRRVLRDEPVTAVPIGMRERLELWQRRHQKTLLAAAVVTLLVFASTAAVLIQKARADASRRAEEVARQAQSKAERARQRAEDASKRAEAEKARAEDEKRRAETEKARAEATLTQVQAVKSALEQSQEKLVKALDEGRLNVCRSFIERARGEMLAENDTRAAVYAAEAAGQARELTGPRARRLESLALGRLRSALFHSPLVWRREAPLGWVPTMIARSADGSRLAVASGATAAVWELPGGALVTTVAAGLRAHRGLALSPDGKTLAIGQGAPLPDIDDGSVPAPHLQLVDLDGERTRTIALDGPCLSLRYRGGVLLGVTAGGALWSFADPAPKRLRDAFLDEGLTGADFSEDGRRVVLAAPGRLAFASADELAVTGEIRFRGRLRMLALSRNGKAAVMVTPRGGLIRFNELGKVLWRIEAGARYAALLGARLLTVEKTGLVLRDPATGERLPDPPGGEATVEPNTSVHRLSENRALLADRAGLQILDLTARRVVLQTPRMLGALGQVTGSGADGQVSLGRHLVDLRTGRGQGVVPAGRLLLAEPDQWLELGDGPGATVLDRAGKSWRPSLGSRVLTACQSARGVRLAFGWFEKGPRGAPPMRFHVWDRTTRKPMGEPVPAESGQSPTLSDTGRLATTVGGRGIIYEPGGAGVVGRYDEDGLTCAILISPDGEWIAVQRLNPTGLWLRRTTAKGPGRCLVAGFSGAAAFSPDSRRLVTAASERVIEVRRLPDLVIERRLTGHAAPISGIEFSSDGRRLVSRGGDVRCWALDEPDERSPVPLPAEFRRRAPQNPVEQPAALGGNDAGTRFGVRFGGQYRILDQTGRTLWSSGENLDAISLVFTPDGKQAVSRTTDALTLIELAGGAPLQSFAATGRSAVLNTPGHGVTVGAKEIFALGAKPVLQGVRRRDGRRRSAPMAILGNLTRLVLSRDESRLIAARDPCIGAISTADFTIQWMRRLHPSRGETRSIGVTEDQVLVSTGPALLKFDIATGEPLATLTLDVPPLEDTRISADGRLIAGLVRGGRPALWDTATGSRYLLTSRGELTSPAVGDMAMAFSRGGRLLHFTEGDRIRVFDTRRVRDALARSLPEDPRAMVRTRTGLRLDGFTLQAPAAPPLEVPER